MFTLAHLSDVHLGPLPLPRLRDLSLKRGLGFANWHRGRKRAHLPSVLGRIVADMAAQAPDHVAVTGDLTNIGLPVEHSAALDWLATLGPPHRVSVVPGNHDAYVTHLVDPGHRRWRPYMESNEEGRRFVLGGRGGFPFVRCFGRVALIGLSSAVPTPPFVAGGRLGRAQREALADVLAATGSAGLARVVLIHHPPLAELARGPRGLFDAGHLREILETHGAELVLYGHNHRNRITRLRGPGGMVPIVGVTSASVARHRHDHRARYNLIRIEPAGGGWRVSLTGRELSTDGAGVVTAETIESLA